MVMIRSAMVATLALAASLSMGQLAEHVPGELLVKFIPGKSAAVNAAIGATELSYNSTIGLSRVKLPANMTVTQGINFYKSKLEVVYAEPNYIGRGQWVPNDPKFSLQYTYPRTQAIQGWDAMKGSPNVVIAIIDTGVSKDHEDLATKLVPGYDFVNDDADPDDDNGHGTHCAGIAAAITNNGKGGAGMAPGCSVMPVKVLSGAGSGAYDWIINGITFAANNGAHVLSMSLGGGGASNGMQDALKAAIAKGALPIAAAGNHGTTQLFYPAAYPECIAVANTDKNDVRNPSSAYGDWVDVAAPGTDIYSTFPGNSYGYSTGTSMACPNVAGLAGLIKSAWPTATVAQLRAQIENNCDPVGSFVNYGRINVLKSVPTFVTTDPYSLAPGTAAMYEGTVTSGTVNSIVASDNSYFSIVSKSVARVGHVASMKGTFKTTKNPASISQLAINMEVAAATNVTVNFFVWDNSTSKWQYVSAFPATVADQTKNYTLSLPYAKYWNANKELQVLVRAVMPNTMVRPANQFTMKVDKVGLTGRVPK